MTEIGVDANGRPLRVGQCVRWIAARGEEAVGRVAARSGAPWPGEQTWIWITLDTVEGPFGVQGYARPLERDDNIRTGTGRYFAAYTAHLVLVDAGDDDDNQPEEP